MSVKSCHFFFWAMKKHETSMKEYQYQRIQVPTRANIYLFTKIRFVNAWWMVCLNLMPYFWQIFCPASHQLRRRQSPTQRFGHSERLQGWRRKFSRFLFFLHNFGTWFCWQLSNSNQNLKAKVYAFWWIHILINMMVVSWWRLLWLWRWWGWLLIAWSIWGGQGESSVPDVGVFCARRYQLWYVPLKAFAQTEWQSWKWVQKYHQRWR